MADRWKIADAFVGIYLVLGAAIVVDGLIRGWPDPRTIVPPVILVTIGGVIGIYRLRRHRWMSCQR